MVYGQDCNSISVTTNDNIELIKNSKYLRFILGVVMSETINERADDFVFNVSFDPTIFYYLHLTTEPENLLTIDPVVYERHGEGLEQYSYRAVCKNRVSYRIQVIPFIILDDSYY